jgi:hypothetical protein
LVAMPTPSSCSRTSRCASRVGMLGVAGKIISALQAR